MTIYLYVKTHRKTGLKYLGKTTARDPHAYHGSGGLWKNILKRTESITILKSLKNVRQIKN